MSFGHLVIWLFGHWPFGHLAIWPFDYPLIDCVISWGEPENNNPINAQITK
jgi:hypothetical protein